MKKKVLKQFNKTTKPNVKRGKVLLNARKRHFMIPVNVTNQAYGVYEATSKAGKKRFPISQALTEKYRRRRKTTYIQTQYRRYPKSQFKTIKEKSTKIRRKDFRKIRKFHINKFKGQTSRYIKISK